MGIASLYPSYESSAALYAARSTFSATVESALSR
jgi:hypothetical protein